MYVIISKNLTQHLNIQLINQFFESIFIINLINFNFLISDLNVYEYTKM